MTVETQKRTSLLKSAPSNIPILTHFRVIRSYLADFVGFRKMLISFERYKLGGSALRRWKKKYFLYRMNSTRYAIKCDSVFKEPTQHVY